ncbi:MAG TPA: TIGR00730 family Rossman fold protein [Candidatus Angelobacter sp.]|nr:TIGR00730 family Rossman fold protein [Candidatus Angelobacter sp.]
MNFRRVCVFCGSNSGINPAYRDAAVTLGRLLVERNIELVYGGGKIGLMGALADAVLSAGGKVTGVIPESLMAKEIGHPGLTDMRVVKSMHERKALMADLSDGFIAMPGGFGTFEEFCEVVTWSQLGIHVKPCGLLNVDAYYDPLLELFDRAVEEGFLREQNRSLVLADPDPARLLEQMANYWATVVSKWIGDTER